MSASWEELRRVLRKEGLIREAVNLKQQSGVALVVLLLLGSCYILGRTHQTDTNSKEIQELTKRIEARDLVIRLLDDSAALLRGQRDSARSATTKARAAAARTRDLVRVIEPGLLEIRTTPTEEPELIEIDSLFTESLVNERNLVDSLEKEVALLEKNDSLNTERIAQRDATIGDLNQKVTLLEKRASCKILWLVSCPSRKTAAVVGAAVATTAIVVGKVLLENVKKGPPG